MELWLTGTSTPVAIPAGHSQAATSSSMWQRFLKWWLGLFGRKLYGKTKRELNFHQGSCNMSFAVDHQMIRCLTLCATGKSRFMLLQVFHFLRIGFVVLVPWQLCGAHTRCRQKMSLSPWGPVCQGLLEAQCSVCSGWQAEDLVWDTFKAQCLPPPQSHYIKGRASLSPVTEKLQVSRPSSGLGSDTNKLHK